MDARELTAADFAGVEWQHVAATATDLWTISHEFYRRAEDAESAGNLHEASVLSALGHACSFSLRLDNPSQPFRPFVKLSRGSSASLDDLDKSTAAAFGVISRTAVNPAIRARLGDVAWVKVRDHAAAADAVEAYVELARIHVDTDSWPDMVRPLERAFQIAAHLGRKHPAGAGVREVVQGLISNAGLSEGFRIAKLMELLLTYGGGNAADLARQAEAIAERELRTSSWHLARKYLELAEGFWGRAKNAEARRAAAIRIAETFEAEAEIVFARPGVGHLLAAGLLEKAIQALRRAGGERDHVSRLHGRLVEVQRGVAGELIPLSTEVDLTSIGAAAEQSVSGLPLNKALVAFASLPIIQPVGQLWARVEQQMREFLFMRFFPRQSIDSDGKVIGKQDSPRLDGTARREAAVRAEMVAQSCLHWEITAAGTIDPARRVIFREHPIRAEDFRELLAYHPAILAEMEILYAEGLYAGFAADLPKAIHILIPQLENAFRTILEKQGVIVSSLDAQGIQQELGIHALLYMPELGKVLGEDLVFAMQALLVDKCGPHLRHRMAHGLMAYDHCFSGYSLAVWWLALRFAMLPCLVALAREIDQEPSHGNDRNTSP